MEDYLAKMLKMQEELDSFILNKNRANPTLLDKGLALLVECVEFMEECGYKWWKKQKTDESSHQYSIKSGNIDNIYKDEPKSRSMPDENKESVSFRDQRLKEELIDILHFWLSICNSLNLNSDEIFNTYTKKWKINFERQTK